MTTQSFIQNSLEHEKNLSNKIVLVFYAFLDKYAKTLLHDRDICYVYGSVIVKNMNKWTWADYIKSSI